MSDLNFQWTSFVDSPQPSQPQQIQSPNKKRMEYQELKAIVKCCVQEKGGSIKLLDLENAFRKIVGECLKLEAQRFQFRSVTAMVQSWPGFAVDGYGLATVIHIETQRLDHIFEMNKRSKLVKTCTGRVSFAEGHVFVGILEISVKLMASNIHMNVVKHACL